MARIQAGEVFEEDEDAYQTSHASSDEREPAASEAGDYDMTDVSSDDDKIGRGGPEPTLELPTVKQTGTLGKYRREINANVRELALPDNVAVGYFRSGLKSKVNKALDDVPDTELSDYAHVRGAAKKIEKDLRRAKTMKRKLKRDERRAQQDTGRPRRVSRMDYAAENRLRPLIPVSFLPTPGFQESSLWHAAIKYVAHITGMDARSPFDASTAALDASFNAKDNRAKDFLRKIIPKPYLKARGRNTPLAESMMLYMQDLKTGTGYRLPQGGKGRFIDLSFHGKGKFSMARMAKVHEHARKAAERAQALQ